MFNTNLLICVVGAQEPVGCQKQTNFLLQGELNSTLLIFFISFILIIGTSIKERIFSQL